MEEAVGASEKALQVFDWCGNRWGCGFQEPGGGIRGGGGGHLKGMEGRWEFWGWGVRDERSWGAWKKQSPFMKRLCRYVIGP